MKLERAKYEPGEALEFYEQGLTALGALCERTWHDRLEIVAEGRAAGLWNSDGSLHQVELHFAPADATVARDAAREVFPGCPLTFQLAEALRHSPLPLERFVFPNTTPPRPPDAAVAEKLWRAQFPDTTRWVLTDSRHTEGRPPFKPDFHFSLVAFARCEIQAMDQHWSLHRIAVSLPDGELDDDLAREIGFHQAIGESTADIAWPSPDPTQWGVLLKRALEQELNAELMAVRARQEHSLRRELERIDDYFENYGKELNSRSLRSSSENAKLKMADRLAAAKAEHARRRADQEKRHEMLIQPHVDGLLLVAEAAWRASLQLARPHDLQAVEALFIPRSRRWLSSM
ncbi:MAG TPA: hypothetical protein VGY56_02845 [Verrucomicrobiae bacterium]|nr:hypothetical protein [Verrucomicrobiae bacterium]